MRELGKAALLDGIVDLRIAAWRADIRDVTLARRAMRADWKSAIASARETGVIDMPLRSSAYVLTLTALIAPGCSTSTASPTDAALGGGDAVVDGFLLRSDTGPLSDGEIVAVLHAIHAGQIALAQYASAHSTNTDVIAYADDVASRYQGADASLTSAASAAGIVAVESDVSGGRAFLAADQLDQLRAAGCATFDRTYVQNHLAIDDAIGLIDSSLLPAVTNSALRDAIVATRAILVFQQDAAPGADPGFWDATVPNWEAGPYEDSGCAPVDASYDVGIDA